MGNFWVSRVLREAQGLRFRAKVSGLMDKVSRFRVKIEGLDSGIVVEFSGFCGSGLGIRF